MHLFVSRALLSCHCCLLAVTCCTRLLHLLLPLALQKFGPKSLGFGDHPWEGSPQENPPPGFSSGYPSLERALAFCSVSWGVSTKRGNCEQSGWSTRKKIRLYTTASALPTLPCGLCDCCCVLRSEICARCATLPISGSVSSWTVERVTPPACAPFSAYYSMNTLSPRIRVSLGECEPWSRCLRKKRC